MKKIACIALLLGFVNIFGISILDLEKACDTGNGRACWDLGLQYGDSKYTSIQWEYFEKACNLGEAAACRALGNAYKFGKNKYQQDIDKDLGKAKTLYEKGCNVGVGDPASGCCYLLANMYYEGLGVNKDLFMAKQFFKKACDLGFGKDPCATYKMLEKQSVK